MPYPTLAAEVQQPAGTPVRVTWSGNPWSLTGLCILNVLLIIVTVGIYWFWARAEYRRYIWQMVRVENEPLEYTGTGKELLIGYVKLFFFVILPAIALAAVAQVALGPKNPAIALVILPLYIGFFFLYFAGIFRANRYILSRTRWRGIASGLNGNASSYAWTSLWTALLSVLTLGWIWPWRTMALRRRITSAMYFGSVPFHFEGRAGNLYAPFAFLWLSLVLAYAGLVTIQMTLHEALRKAQIAHPGESVRATLHRQEIPHTAVWVILAAIPLVLIGLSWFEARKLNVFARATKIGTLDAKLEASGGSVLWLTVSNLLILVLSVGILRPVAQARRLRYLVKRFSFSGSADLDAVARGPEQGGSQGAGLEAAFSIEIF